MSVEIATKLLNRQECNIESNTDVQESQQHKMINPNPQQDLPDGNHEMEAGIPESYNVLTKEIRSLGIPRNP